MFIAQSICHIPINQKAAVYFHFVFFYAKVLILSTELAIHSNRRELVLLAGFPSAR
jgi:hypothetical protein